MAGFDLSPGMLMSLEERLTDYAEGIAEARQAFRESLGDDVMRLAKANPRWIGLADFVDTWDENDRTWVGIRGLAEVSDAFAAEYGSDEYPPAPLLRTLDQAAVQARVRADNHLTGRFGGQV